MKKKALVIKIGAIGDVIRALSILEPLKDYDITWVCGKIPSPFVNSTRRVSKVIEVDEEKLFKEVFFQKIWELFKTWKKIGFFKSFDLIVIAHSDWRYSLLSLFTLSKKTTKFSRKLGEMNPLPSRYFACEYARLINNNNSNPVFPKIYYEESSLSKEIFAKDEKVIALAPGGANNILNPDSLRRWPIERYAELAEKLVQEGFRVLITGSSADEWTIKYFSNPQIKNLIGKTSLLDLYGIYKKCALVITHDCGPLHIATLAGCCTLAIFGPTDPRTVAGAAFHPNVKIIFGGEKEQCSPCYDGRYFTKCENNRCMQNISAQKVFEKAMQIVKEQILKKSFAPNN